jgi:hypothetical protein
MLLTLVVWGYVDVNNNVCIPQTYKSELKCYLAFSMLPIKFMLVI